MQRNHRLPILSDLQLRRIADPFATPGVERLLIAEVSRGSRLPSPVVFFDGINMSAGRNLYDRHRSKPE